MPEPALAQPADTAFAWPTTWPENIELIQNWLDTKFARENPMRNRMMMNPPAEETSEAARMAGAVKMERVAEATRGPKRSQAGPMAKRERMAPAKEAMPAAPTSAGERWRSERIKGRRGGMEKVEKKHEKRENHARWNASMWGEEIEKGLNTVALPLESTGTEKESRSLRN